MSKVYAAPETSELSDYSLAMVLVSASGALEEHISEAVREAANRLIDYEINRSFEGKMGSIIYQILIDEVGDSKASKLLGTKLAEVMKEPLDGDV